MQFVPGKMMKKRAQKDQDQRHLPQFLKYTEEDQRWKSNM